MNTKKILIKHLDPNYSLKFFIFMFPFAEKLYKSIYIRVYSQNYFYSENLNIKNFTFYSIFFGFKNFFKRIDRLIGLPVKRVAILAFFFLISMFRAAHGNEEGEYDPKVVNGILIEGMDCSGKSTVCELLGEKMKEKEFNVKLNHLFLSENIIVKFLLNKAISSEGTRDGDLFYAAGALLDQFIYKKRPDVFYIQDRNWLSQDSWVSFVCDEKQYAPKNYFQNNHFYFKWNVFLNVSYKKFVDRYEKRKKRSFLNKKLAQNSQYFEEYQNFFLSRIPEDEDWLIIDTDNLMPEEVVSLILDYFGW